MIRYPLLLLLILAPSTLHAADRPADLYVSPVGKDAWSGKLAAPNADKTDGPFATLERARDEIRSWKQHGKTPEDGPIVELGSGRHQRTTPFSLTDADSGTETSPIVWRGERDGDVRITGGPVISDWTPVSDSAVLEKLDPSVKGKILQADLRKLGVTDFGNVDSNRLELFYDDRPMTLARYPNEGFLEIADILGPTPRVIHGKTGAVEGIFSYSGDRPAKWSGERDAWLHGYWFWDWADQRQQITAIDLEKKSITLQPPHHHYGYRKGQWYYAFNLLSELDAPGEWYLDRDRGLLYFLPPQQETQESGDPPKTHTAVISISPRLIAIDRASHIEFSGITFEAARETGINVADSDHIRVDACTIRNIGSTGLFFDGGTNNTLVNSDVTDIGQGAVVVKGGNAENLLPADHLVDNCHITRYGRWKPMYSAGISINGVGIRLAHNLIHDAPHMAILFRGNDHLIELNEIHRVCLESNDAGAIYSGRNWTWRGTTIRHNYLHHVTGFRDRGCLGVYLDDMLCGTNVTGNLFYKVKNASTICGGRDIHIENNIFVDCQPALHVDDRALNWADYHALEWIKEAREKGTVSGIRYNQPPYSERYPELARMMEEDPAAPRGNVIARNIQWGGSWADLNLKDKSVLTFDRNLL
ncbi:MAG: right-handed parallel beta-helix repeat-containing protein, partial [Planctomycetaceae bacterium]|nr:right-handed parallel beta-helix repeat-containing protein [Planctomycetaceae bacterium]